MIEIQKATRASQAQLCEAMNLSFSDYAVPLTFTEDAFARAMQQRGLVREVSWIARDVGRIAALWLISIRENRGYLISSGTVPDYRSRGLAKQLGKAALAGLKARGIVSFQTEVLSENNAAKPLYLGLQMHPARNLTCYDLPMFPPAKPSGRNISVCPWKDLRQGVADLRDWSPTWQNSDLSIDAVEDAAICIQARGEAGLEGYLVYFPFNKTIAQMAVHQRARRKGLGTNMLCFAQSLSPDAPMRIINAEAADQGFSGFMSALGAKMTVGQIELSIDLRRTT